MAKGNALDEDATARATGSGCPSDHGRDHHAGRRRGQRPWRSAGRREWITGRAGRERFLVLAGSTIQQRRRRSARGHPGCFRCCRFEHDLGNDQPGCLSQPGRWRKLGTTQSRSGRLGDLVVTGLLQNPSKPEELTISTWGYGLFRSTNGGAQWTRLTDPLAVAGRATAALLRGRQPSRAPDGAGVNSRTLMYQPCAANMYQKNRRTHCEMLRLV